MSIRLNNGDVFKFSISPPEGVTFYENLVPIPEGNPCSVCGSALSRDRLQPSTILKFPDHGVLVYCDTKACTEAVDLPWDDFSEIEEREKLRARFNDDALMLANVQ